MVVDRLGEDKKRQVDCQKSEKERVEAKEENRVQEEFEYFNRLLARKVRETEEMIQEIWEECEDHG